MQLVLRGELAFVTATLTFRGVSVAIPDVLVDTGAASTVFNADLAAEAGVLLGHGDRLRMLRGVGMDFLRAAGAMIDLRNLTIDFA